MPAWPAGAPEIDIIVDFSGEGKIKVVEGDLKNLGKAAVGATNESKEIARYFRRAGTAIGLFDNAAGAALFRLSRMSMTMGWFGVTLAAVSGAYYFLADAGKKMREEWDKQIAVIGKVHEEYEDYFDTITDPSKRAIMQRFGIEFDPDTVAQLEDREKLYPAWYRGQKLEEASENAFVTAMERLLGGVDNLAAKIDEQNKKDIFDKALDNADKIYGTPLNDFLSALDTAGKRWRGLWGGVDPFAEPEEGVQMYVDKEIKNLQYELDELRKMSAVKAWEKGINVPKEEERLIGAIEAFQNLDPARLKELGYRDLAKRLDYYMEKQQIYEEEMRKGVPETIKEIEHATKQIRNTLTTHIAPTGIWSVNRQGTIPYVSTPVPLDILYGGGSGESPVSGSPSSGSTAAASSLGGGTSASITPTSVSGSSSAGSGSSGIGSIVFNNNFHITLNDIKELLTRPDVLSEVVSQFDAQIASRISGAGARF